MITDRTLTNLRTAASLLLLSPGLSVSVEVNGRPVVAARRPVAGTVDGDIDGAPGPAVVPVCAFHRCVGKAHRLRRAGSQVEMVGVPGDLEPDVVLDAGADVAILPSGIVRRTVDDHWLHVVALSLPVETVEPIAAETSAASTLDLELHADRVLDVSVLVGYSPKGDRAAAHEIIEILETVAARATVVGLVELLEPTPGWEHQLPALAAGVETSRS